jgi:hypothetical protein
VDFETNGIRKQINAVQKDIGAKKKVKFHSKRLAG